jgi:hypothetical protein
MDLGTFPARNRSPQVILILIALVASSCTKAPPAVEFRVSSNWSPQERATLASLPELLRPGAFNYSFPICRATWKETGVVHHVCLQYPGIELCGTPYNAYVFDDAGNLLEQSQITAGQDYEPRQLLSVSPVRVSFARPNLFGSSQVLGFGFSTEEWRRQKLELTARIAEIRARLAEERQPNEK